jgi:hypothetical protein
MSQAIAVQQRDGREDPVGLFLYESAQVIKDFGERIPAGHHLEDSSLDDEDGFCAGAFRVQHPFRAFRDVSPFILKQRALWKNHREIPRRTPHVFVLRSIACNSLLWATRRRPRPIIGIHPNAFCGDKPSNSTQRSLTKSTTKLTGSPGGVLDSNCGIALSGYGGNLAGALAPGEVVSGRMGQMEMCRLVDHHELIQVGELAPWRRRFFGYD